MRNTEQTMAEYTITNPNDIRIKSLLLSDIQGMHTLLKKEGCIDSENKFTDVKQSVLTPTQYNRLKRQFAGKPQFRFVNAIDFWKLF